MTGRYCAESGQCWRIAETSSSDWTVHSALHLTRRYPHYSSVDSVLTNDRTLNSKGPDAGSAASGQHQ
jgi:hypothetical protein